MPFPYEAKLKKMVIDAMEENAPTMYERLKAAGQMEEFAQMRASAATEQFNEQMSEMSPADTKLIVSAQNKGYWEAVQALSMW